MTKFAIFGLGNMGEAILKALLKSGVKKKDIYPVEVKAERASFIKQLYGVTMDSKPDAAVKAGTFIFVAVKPQDARQFLTDIAPFVEERHVIVSIMAGVTSTTIASHLGKPVKVVRVMPNLAIRVGEGAIGMAHNDMVTPEELEEARKLFASAGTVVEVSEDLLDSITALGASGPAFLLLFIEAMIDAGVRVGLPRDKSKAIVLQMVRGTLNLLYEEDLHPGLMREMITSPGGTTIAGLTIMEERGFKGTVIRAVEEARNRSKELSQ
jgi:pyrroline-5-carboxylate reductase